MKRITFLVTPLIVALSGSVYFYRLRVTNDSMGCPMGKSYPDGLTAILEYTIIF